MRKIFYIYFDLRKYSFIDRYFKPEEQFKLLSEMHRIIESGMEGINGSLYHLVIDTALYFAPSTESDKILDTLKTIKKDVDDYFSSKGAPSTLHIACVFGDSVKGEINLRDKKIFNIIGNVNSALQKAIYAVESPEGEILFDKICFDEAAIKEIGQKDLFKKYLVFDHEFYYAQ